MYQSIKSDLLFLENKEKAFSKTRFFKSEHSKGKYGLNDTFIGVSNPEMHQIAKHYYKSTSQNDLQILIKDEIHEVRLTALTIMVLQMKKVKMELEKEKIVELYLKNTDFINNWDLVDASCYYILGEYLKNKSDRSILYKLAKSKHIWSERIAMVSTLALIKIGQFDDMFNIAEILKYHTHDLIHKAIGWMLKVAWQKGAKIEVEAFLRQNITLLSRTTIRYAIEKMEETERKEFLNLK